MARRKQQVTPNRKPDKAPTPDLAEATFDPQQLDDLRQEIQELREKLAATQNQDPKPHRRRLPDTRQSVTHKFCVAGHEGYVTVGLFDDGKPAETFIRMAKEGSTVGGLIDAIGILTSLALQYGVPVESLARKFQHTRFEPSGRTANPAIREASSISDYIFTWLGLSFSEEFRNEYQLAQRSEDNPVET